MSPIQSAGATINRVIVQVDDPADARLGDYVALTDPALRRRVEPATGIFIAEGEKVIRRAVGEGTSCAPCCSPNAGCQVCRTSSRAIRVCLSWWSTDLLRQVTGFNVHRGALAAKNRPAVFSVSDLARDAQHLAVLHDLVDPSNVGAVFRLRPRSDWMGSSSAATVRTRSTAARYAFRWGPFSRSRTPASMIRGEGCGSCAPSGSGFSRSRRSSAVPLSLSRRWTTDGAPCCSAPRARGCPPPGWTKRMYGTDPDVAWHRLAQRGVRRRGCVLRPVAGRAYARRVRPDLSWQGSLLDAGPPQVDVSFAELRRVSLDETSWIDVAPGGCVDPTRYSPSCSPRGGGGSARSICTTRR